MSENKSSGGVGGGFVGLLQLLFIGLKLGGAIDWSWWWVMSPFIASTAVGIFFLALAGLLYFISRTK